MVPSSARSSPARVRGGWTCRPVDPDQADDITRGDDEIEGGEQDAGAVAGRQAMGDEGLAGARHRRRGTVVNGELPRAREQRGIPAARSGVVPPGAQDVVGQFVEHALERTERTGSSLGRRRTSHGYG